MGNRHDRGHSNAFTYGATPCHVALQLHAATNVFGLVARAAGLWCRSWRRGKTPRARATDWYGDAARWVEKKRGDVDAADEDPGDEVGGEEPFEVDDAVIGDVVAAMDRAREAAAPDHAGSFRIVPLGGMWTAAHAGVAQDAWQGKAVAGAPS